MNPKIKVVLPAIAAIILLIIDFFAPTQILNYFDAVFKFSTRQTNIASLYIARGAMILFLCYLFAAVSNLLRGFRPRLRWGLSILSVFGVNTVLVSFSNIIQSGPARNYTNLILNFLTAAFVVLIALLILLLWVRFKKDFEQTLVQTNEKEITVIPMPLSNSAVPAEVTPVVSTGDKTPASIESATPVVSDTLAASQVPAAPAAPESTSSAPVVPVAPQNSDTPQE